jgi:PAS domain S-box-containing protein
MKNINIIYGKIADNIIWFSLVLCGIYWLLDSLIHSYLFGGGNFIDQVFLTDSRGIWVRTLVIFILIVSSSLMQIIVNRRKKAEEAQQQSMQFLQLVLDTIPVRVFWKDCNLRYMGCNKLFAQDSGLQAPQDLIGKDDFQMGWKEQAELYRTDDRKVIKSRKPKLNFEEPQTTPDGSKIWLRTSKTPLYDQNDRIIGVLGTYEDITVQKRTEEAMKESEEKYRNLVERAHDGIAIVQNEKIIYVNLQFAEMLGYSTEELTDKHFKIAIPPANLPKLAKRYERRMAGEPEPEIYETTLLKKNGEKIDVELNAGLITFGGELATMYIGRNISDRKLAEEEMRLSQFTINHTGDAAFWISPNGRFVYVNDVACRSLGYTREELLNMAVCDIDPDFPEERWPGHWEELKEKKNFGIESHHRTKDGRVFPVEISINYLEFNGKEYNCAFARDISDRKQAEKAHLESEVILRAALESTADGILVVDDNGKVVTLNKRFGDMWHIPQELLDEGDDDKLLGYAIGQLSDPEKFLTKVKELYQSPKKNLDTINFKDGRIFERFSCPLLVEQEIKGRVWSFRDISEQKAYQKAGISVSNKSMQHNSRSDYPEWQ